MLEIKDLGLIDYRQAYTLQKELVDDVCQGGSDKLLLCEHPAILTLGRSAHRNNIFMSEKDLKDRGIDILDVDRGGDITLHAPGQLVAYPIINLANFNKDLKVYLNKLEQVAIDLLSEFDIVASRFSGRTGAWIQEKKIASIGIGVRKWVSFHGIGLNINTDLGLFSLIRPCGLNVNMTSLAFEKNRKIEMECVKNSFIKHFQNEFYCE